MRAVDLRHRRPDAVAGGAGSPVTPEIVSGVTQPPPRRPRKRSATRSVTLADVAAAAGVSAHTVSRVVRAPLSVPTGRGPGPRLPPSAEPGGRRRGGPGCRR
ncbi:LacI family DNA-binding transcriptional regulator [Streptomyces olivaceus]|uniref:LacI family DNA-binding transcriptional regulator n=1 Tax=Streptomyces olivaceus TaxID=47716 RepID=UPI003556854D